MRIVRLLSLLSMGAICGCGLLNEKEIGAPSIQRDVRQVDCDLPPSEKLFKSRYVTADAIQQALECAEKQLDEGFKSLRGKIEGELEISEIRLLHREKLFDIPEKLDEDAFWRAAEFALRFFHPQGRAALSHLAFRNILNWMRKYRGIYLQWMNIDWHNPKPTIKWPLIYDSILALEDLLPLIFQEGSLRWSEIHDWIPELNKVDWIKQSMDLTTVECQNKGRALWKLKSFILEETQDQGDESNLVGAGLKKWASLLISIAKRAELTTRWALDELLPKKLPAGLDEEWRELSYILKDYFESHRFAPIATDQLRWVVRVLSPKSGQAELVGDLIRMGRRLSPEMQLGTGLHPRLFTKLFAELPKVARDISLGSSAFTHCEDSTSKCSVPVRSVYQDHPVLKQIALKGAWRFGIITSDTPLPKRLDAQLVWKTAMGRILERGLMGSIFKAFDYNKDGKIPFLEGSSKELAESLDLATTFLRFTSLDHKPEEEDSPLAYPVFVKPESMYRSMGLVGDRWMPDGNHDGVLNSDEFFSIVKIYREIQDLGRRYPNVTIYQEDPHLPYWESPGGPIFSRKQYIQNIAAVLSFPLPHLYRDLLSLKDPIRDSLLHALTPVPSEPIQVYQYAGSPPIVLKQYLRTEAGLAPAAIVTLLDRLMVVCDTDEDNSLSWRELDCALPLLLDGSIETLTSELVELDPGIHDGVRFILIFLGMKGLPHAMAKLIAINGGWRNFYLDPADLQAIISKLSISWRSLAYFIGAPPDATPSQQSFWVAEAMSRYGHCDTNTDGKIQDTEVNCVTNRVLEQIQELLSDLGHSFAGESVTHEISQWLKNSPLVQMGILFSINDQQQLGDALESEQVLRSSPEKILRVIEESIRRRRPLCLQPDC